MQKEIQARYQGSVLGLLWSYVQPMVRFAMYFFVIGLVLGLHKSVPNYSMHIFSAITVVHFFTETFSSGTRAIVRNKAIVKKMAMPREMFPVASVIVSAIHVFPQLLILVIGGVVTGWRPDFLSLAAAVLSLAIVTVFGTALALLFSALNVFFRDFQNIVSTLTIFTHWVVPMIYPFARLAEGLQDHKALYYLYLADPLAPAVLLMQRAFWLPTFQSNAQIGYPDVPDHLWLLGCPHAGRLLRGAGGLPDGLLPPREQDRGAPLMSESIVVDHVSKQFTMRYHRTIKQMTIAMLRRNQISDSFLAVNDVSFTIEQGESVGLMGLNGSGKSTLLKLINGVMRPDAGKVRTRGRIAGLIATGAGFHPQLTGRDNVYLNAAILGMSEAETKRKFDQIVEFADIGKFLDTPVGFYSSGMFSRLGFAVAVHTDSDIFLVDEVLAVGDRPFKKKCLERMEEIRQEGRTMLYVSHATGSVRKMCDRVLVLEQGVLGFDGPVDEGIRYLQYDEGEDDINSEEADEEMEDEELGADI